MTDQNEKIVCTNRRARHDYRILEVVEAGLVLTGSEVKSLRQGRASLVDSYAVFENGEAFLLKMHISHYEQAASFSHDPTRRRKLLLHQREIGRLAGKVREKGLTVVPLKLYFSKGWAKVELGLAQGKSHYDKREDIAKREAEREISRAVRRRR